MRKMLLTTMTVSLVGLWACAPATTDAPPPPVVSAPAIDGPADSAPAQKLTLGFAQVGAESDWRKANTESIKAEAEKRGHELKFSDAQQKQENQIKAIRSFIAQGVDVIAFAPVVETGWDAVLAEAKAANIPVILSDRTINTQDETLYTAFVGSDFREEGRRAGKWLAEKTNGEASILELQGTPGSAPANERKAGFAEAIADFPNMKIVKSQTGEFTRAMGKEVMEAFLKTPEGQGATALYAHNDDMAIGAIQAIEAAGKKPGQDIVIVSVDGVKDAFLAIQEGKLNCTVECNPLLGPPIFDLAEKLVAGEQVPKITYSEEGVFDESNYADVINDRKY